VLTPSGISILALGASQFCIHHYCSFVHRSNKSKLVEVCHVVKLMMILLLIKAMVEDLEKLVVAQLAKKFLAFM
jgi:hypothetical protein